jgi:hypothetical protein
MSVLLDEAMDKCAFPNSIDDVYEEIDKAMEVGRKIISIRPWIDVEFPPDEGENIEVIWCGQPSKGYYEGGMFKVDAWVPAGLGILNEGTYYKKVVNATAWRKR